MCGICGVISEKPIFTNELVTRMQNSLVHRGPDSEGEYVDTNIALGVRRLSIIDLNSGSQPLFNEDRSLILIANAEIYNFVELRNELRNRGHQFRTRNDCETILHLYEDYGQDCVKYLRGMFAFALWDKSQKRLLLARDRMGEKPMYLYESNGALIFASELKALMRSGIVPFELDPVSIDLYFHYLYVPEPRTPIKRVRKLSASHTLIVDFDPWNVEETCYWKMEDAAPIRGNPGEIIRNELETISDIIVRSDVPVGIALSGGIDSSGIAALTVRKYPEAMHAFCVGYEGSPPSDERQNARALAKHLGMVFHEVEVKTADMADFFPQLVYWNDDPIADIASFAYYSVMKLARQHNVSVILQGHGGDELFWGYPSVRQAVIESLQKFSFWETGAGSVVDYLFPKEQDWNPLGKGLSSWYRYFLQLRNHYGRFKRHKSTPPERMIFYDLNPEFQVASKNLGKLYTSQFTESLHGSSAFDIFTFSQPWSRIDIIMTRLICQTYLQENGIAQGDRLSMACSVEMRLPFVDFRLVETVIGLRKSYSDYMLPQKAWLKSALKGILPDWILTRPKKGFTPPVHEWLQALFSKYSKLLKDGFLVQANVINHKKINRIMNESTKVDFTRSLAFRALVLETWCRTMSSLT